MHSTQIGPAEALFIFFGFMLGLVIGNVTANDVNRFVANLRGSEERDMSLYAEFKEDAEHAEGRVAHVYEDTLGYKTAGIGHKLVGTEKELAIGTQVTKDQIDIWFKEDYDIVLDSVNTYFPNFEEYPRLAQLAVLNFIFQLGHDAPLKFPRATAAINAQDWAEAANQWEYANVKSRRKSKWYHETQARCLQEVERLRECIPTETPE